MQTGKEKLSNVASAAKENLEICKATVEEKVEKATAKTEEEKEIAQERRKAKEAKAKMELHEAKAQRAAEKLRAKQAHLHGHHLVGTQQGHYEPVVDQTHGHQPVGTTATPMTGTTVPTYPLGGHPTGREYK